MLDGAGPHGAWSYVRRVKKIITELLLLLWKLVRVYVEKWLREKLGKLVMLVVGLLSLLVVVGLIAFLVARC